MKASQVQSRPPIAVARLEPSDFSDNWRGRPSTGVAVGIRMLSDAAECAARINAAKETYTRFAEVDDEELLIQDYNDALLSQVVGSSICDPNDIYKMPEQIPVPTETVRLALLPRAIARLFDEYMIARARNTPGIEEATDDDLLTLLYELPRIPPRKASLIRKILKSAVDIAEN